MLTGISEYSVLVKQVSKLYQFLLELLIIFVQLKTCPAAQIKYYMNP